MPVSEIKPGMRGVGKTVFSGGEIETFEFEVLDILPNFRSKRDLILVKLTGDKVQYTNVVAGMSGSPMYIDDKLVGALAYRMGIFLKDPIAGITPIEQMFEVFEREKVRSEELASNRGINWDHVDMAVGVKDIRLENFIPPYFHRSGAASSSVVPLELPLLCSGFEPAAVELSARIFAGLGFEIRHGGGTVATEEGIDVGPLQPGSAYSVVLVDGDLGLQATGTVTYVDGARVIGMGHPFLNSGAVGLPMGKAKILTTISSMMASTKMSALTEIVGTVHQDRTTGVMGISGELPQMIPFHLSLISEAAPPVDFNFRIAEDRSLHSITPLVFSIILTNALESARLSASSQTLELEGQINLKGREPIPVKNYFAGSSPVTFLTDAVEAAGEVSAIIGALLSNNFEPPEIESVDLRFEALHQKYFAFVERLVVDQTAVKPGDEITVTAYLKEYQGERHKVSQTLKLPQNIQGRRINVFAGSGTTLTRLEVRTSPQKFRPKTFQQLIELLHNRRKNNFVFFQVRLPDKGILVEGEELPGLPPSILSVMRSQKSSGNLATLRDRVLVEEQVETHYSVSGGKTVWLKIEPK